LVICGLDSSGSGNGLVAGSCEYRKEPAGSVTDGEFLFEYLRDHWLLKKGFGPWS